MSRTPFLFFTDHHGELADAVREGRRREFASFTRFGGEDIPDPNARETFERSRVAPTGDDSLYRTLLKLRHDTIVPRLRGARTLDSQVLGPAAVLVRWRMGDGATLPWPPISVPSRRRSPRPAASCSLPPPTRQSPAARWRPTALPSSSSRLVNDETILAQARKAGIAIDWTDANGRPQRVSVASLKRILDSLDDSGPQQPRLW